MTPVAFYWIGGSPCAGKSSVAAALADRFGLRHVECDKASADRVARMAGGSLPAYEELTALSTCERLSRSPEWQADRELAFYREQFSFVMEELSADEPAIVEGADLLPDLLHRAGVGLDRAVWMVPTPEFQLRHYSAREWVSEYLKDCADPSAAFRNWMCRDVLFAEQVRDLAATVGGRVIVVDGMLSLAETVDGIAEHFGLTGPGGPAN